MMTTLQPGVTEYATPNDTDIRGAWSYVWRQADGTEMPMSGTFREVNPPESFVHTESWGPEWPETINTLTFVESAGLTTITMLIHYPSKDARDAALETGMKEGMDVSFANLDAFVESLA